MLRHIPNFAERLPARTPTQFDTTILRQMRLTAIDSRSPCSSQSCCLRWSLRRRWELGPIFVAVLIAIALPSYADAKPAYKVHPGGLELILPVEKRAGYVISVSANGRQRVQVTVEGSSSAIEYSTKGRVTSRHIVANFGALGRLDVSLHLAHYGHGIFRQRHCKGHDPMEGEGTYRGTIKLSHERDVPEVSIHRGRFYLERRFRQICRRRRSQPKPMPYPKLERKLEEGNLTVRGKAEGRTVRLHATIFAFRQHPAYSGGTLQATAYERREGVRVTRRVGMFFYHNSLTMSVRGEEPETVKVNLPSPFAGSALYSSSPGLAPSWTGDLRVDLPGVDGVSLVGAGFRAVLCRGKVNSCLFRSGSTTNS
jgi:hypothetical protein